MFVPDRLKTDSSSFGVKIHICFHQFQKIAVYSLKPR